MLGAQVIKKWSLLAILFTAIAGALPLYAQGGGLEGDATLRDGSPCVKCQLQIDRQDIKGSYPVKTDKKGHFVYVGLPLGNYKVSLQDPNGKPLYSFTGIHVGLGDPTVCDFDMKKLAAEDAKAQQANPEVQKQMEEQNKEQTKLTGLKQLYDQGNVLFDQKKYADAAALFEQAVPLAKEKNLNAVLGRLGDCYERADQHDKALAAYQKVLASDPSNAEVHNSIGNVYLKMNKTPEGMAEFQKAAELNPAGAAKAYYNLGAVLFNANKMDEAAAAWRKAIEADPKYADAYALLGRALVNKATMSPDNKTMIAPPGTAEALETYLKLDPNGKFAAEAQGDLQLLQGTIQTEMKVEKKKKKP